MEFVVVNVTAGSTLEWLRVLSDDGGEFGDFGAARVAPVLYSNRQEWLDLLVTKNASLMMSVTLCYASYDTTDLAVEVSSGSKRTELLPRYDPLKRNYDYSNIRSQLGQIDNGQHAQSPDEPGVLSLLKRDSWEPGPADVANSSWLQAVLGLSLVGDRVDTQHLDTTTLTVATNITAYFYSATELSKQDWEAIPRLSPDPSMTALFQQILKSQGGIAPAIQSILTVFTGMSYRDQIQQFNNASKVITTSFVVVSKPASLRGIRAVTTVASVHLLLIAYVSYQFLFTSSISTIGNAWQMVAQVVQGEAKQLIDGARLATDDKVEASICWH